MKLKELDLERIINEEIELIEDALPIDCLDVPLIRQTRVKRANKAKQKALPSHQDMFNNRLNYLKIYQLKKFALNCPDSNSVKQKQLLDQYDSLMKAYLNNETY